MLLSHVLLVGGVMATKQEEIIYTDYSKETKVNKVLHWLVLINEFPPEYIARKIVEELDGN